MDVRVQDLLNNLPNNSKIEIKSGWFWKILDFFVRVFSFNTNKKFMTNYVTTIGNIISMPVSIWDMRNTDPLSFYELLNHELTHVRQFKKYGLGSIYLGVVIQSLLYLLLPLPMGFAWFRYKFESEAYLEGFKAVWRMVGENNSDYDIEQIRLDAIDSTYTHMISGDYGFAMSFCKAWVRKDLVKRFNTIKFADTQT